MFRAFSYTMFVHYTALWNALFARLSRSNASGMRPIVAGATLARAGVHIQALFCSIAAVWAARTIWVTLTWEGFGAKHFYRRSWDLRARASEAGGSPTGACRYSMAARCQRVTASIRASPRTISRRNCGSRQVDFSGQ